MKPALLLVDLQLDFLERPGLAPPSERLVGQVVRLLDGARQAGVAVAHVHTQVKADGTDRMPHWRRAGVWSCVEGTPGASAPAALAPAPGETRLSKRYFSAFGNPALDLELRRRDIDTVIIAGLYLHGCVRSTALDAYERGYEVWVADDAVGSTEPEHAEITRDYLDGRVGSFIDTAQILRRLGLDRDSAWPAAAPKPLPAACIGGRWLEASGPDGRARRNPSNWAEIIVWTSFGDEALATAAAEQARRAQPAWSRVPAVERAERLFRWADALGRRRRELVGLLAWEIGKPVTEGRAEIGRALALIRTAASGLDDGLRCIDRATAVYGRHRPCGVIGLITPWNNPLAIPAGKIAPALAFGNTIIWKPAVEAPQTAMALMEALAEADLQDGRVNLVFGEAAIARRIIANPAVAAVSLTGSSATGRAAAALCARFGKPLQAELGGNNAAIVLRDCDLPAAVDRMALAAFAFSGQRCTAIRRFIVERPILAEFEDRFVATVKALRIGHPGEMTTAIGPLISRSHRQHVANVLARAESAGARLYCGGAAPAEWEGGCWLTPAVVGGVDPQARIVREETFGPVAVILPADSLEHAIELANDVEQGLVGALCSDDENSRRRFAAAIEAGVVNFAPGPLPVHPAAPFGGWKASGFGPPEHGDGDRQFYSRRQALYGWSERTD